MLLLKSTVCKIFTFKYQFQYHSDSTPSSDKVNGFCFLLIRWMASVSFPHSSNVCSGSKFSEQVWNYAKRVDCFTVATNAHVQLLIVITTVKSIHLTVGGSKVAKTHKLHTVTLWCGHIYCCSANFHWQNPVLSVEILVIESKRFTRADFATSSSW